MRGFRAFTVRPFLTRNIVCPIQDVLLRRPTRCEWRRLEESQWLAPTELLRLHRKKLKNLLLHARSNVPFYRRRFDAIGGDPARHDPLELLARLPLLTKREIRVSVQEMLWPQAPGGLFNHNTGGSTGEPLQFFFDRRRQACDQAARIRAHRWFGVSQGDRELFVWGSPIETERAGRRWRDALLNHHVLDAFHMSPSRMDGYLNSWRRYRPACVFGYPSSLARLVEHARSRDVDLRAPNLKAVFVTGERCYDLQRATLESELNVPVANDYGSREGGFIAHQCPSGRMHIMTEHVHVEIVRDGLPVPFGETGEIVITHLDAYAMPFIRYRTGDIGRRIDERCSCGRGLPLMDIVEGRTTDFIVLPDGNVKHALSIIYPLREWKGLRQFRVSQAADFSLTVQAVADGSLPRMCGDTLCQALGRVVDDLVPIRVEWLDELPSSPSGKFRYVESRVPTTENTIFPRKEVMDVGI